MNVDNDEAAWTMGGDGLFTGCFAIAIQASIAVKVFHKPAAFANDNLLDSSRRPLEDSSGDGDKRHAESDGSGKFSYGQAATSSWFNFLFDFLFQATM